MDWLAGREMLAWTLHAPKKNGWYWAELDSGVVKILKVVNLSGQMICTDELSTLVNRDNVRWWAGPIKQPAARLTCASREETK